MRSRKEEVYKDAHMTEVKHRVRGVLLGLAAGDRNSGPTNMAVRFAESLVANKQLDLHDVGARYLAWWREGAMDTGPTAARVLSLVDAGEGYEDASARVHQAQQEGERLHRLQEQQGQQAGHSPAGRQGAGL